MKLYTLKPGFKKARKKAGFTQKELSKKMDVSLKTVMNWEQGLVSPPLETVIEIADILDCDIDFLCGRIQCKSHDYQYIHNETGLSEASIEALHKLQGSPEGKARLEIIDNLLSNVRFARVLTDNIIIFIKKYLIYGVGKRQYDRDLTRLRGTKDVMEVLEEDDKKNPATIVDSGRLAEREATMMYYRRQTQNAFDEILEDLAKSYNK